MSVSVTRMLMLPRDPPSPLLLDASPHHAAHLVEAVLERRPLRGQLLLRRLVQLEHTRARLQLLEHLLRVLREGGDLHRLLLRAENGEEVLQRHRKDALGHELADHRHAFLADAVGTLAGARVVLEELQTGVDHLQLVCRLALETESVDRRVHVEEDVVALAARVDQIPVEVVANAVECLQRVQATLETSLLAHLFRFHAISVS